MNDRSPHTRSTIYAQDCRVRDMLTVLKLCLQGRMYNGKLQGQCRSGKMYHKLNIPRINLQYF
jgi:hypothetical protein